MVWRSIGILAVLFLAATVLITGGSVVAADEDVEVHYCYGETAVLEYPRDDEVSVSWDISLYDSDGSLVDSRSMEGVKISFSLEGVASALVTQTVSDGSITDTKTIRIQAMHVNQDDDELFVVTFHDGNRVIDSHEIDGTWMVHPGEAFVYLPDTPVRVGYTFLGWFHLDDDGAEVPFDPYEPVYSDMDVYAKWVGNGTGTGGDDQGGSVVVEGTYLVTFQVDPGIYYTITSSGKGFVSFTVSVFDGFHYGDIRVSSDGGDLDPIGGVYTLAGIRSDVTVTISGERQYAVSYHIGSATAHVEGYGDNPSLVASGPLLMTIDGPESMEIFVFMSSKEITGECVRGDVITIADVTGDLFILVVDTTAPAPTPEGSDGDGFPWWVVALFLAIVVFILIVYLIRNRS